MCLVNIFYHFFTGVEIAKRLAYADILSNLVTYLTVVLHESIAVAAKNVNVWTGVSMLPFIGSFIADSYVGQYWIIVRSSVIYLLVSIFFFFFLEQDTHPKAPNVLRRD